jgi:hypothetical protein
MARKYTTPGVAATVSESLVSNPFASMTKVILLFPSRNKINTMELSTSEAAGCAATQEFPCIL